MIRTNFLYGLVAMALLGIVTESSSRNNNKQHVKQMKINAGIATVKLQETKAFYQRVLQLDVLFENDFYVLMKTGEGQPVISFLQAEHPSQQPIFQSLYPGKGMYLTIEVPDADAEYKRITALDVKIEVPLRDEPWGDRHFSFYDPNGIGIDIVTYKKPE
jgi:catechol 2,3-dioxygenase-like lactoylglutathione lyase family enzyme